MIHFRVNARFGPEDGVQPNTAQVVGSAFSQYSNMTVEDANAIRSELQSIQTSLAIGEHEKVELMKNLACLKDDLTRLQHSDSSLDVSSASAAAFAAGNHVEGQGGGMAVNGGPLDRFSTASQTDLSGEVCYYSSLIDENNKTFLVIRLSKINQFSLEIFLVL